MSRSHRMLLSIAILAALERTLAAPVEYPNLSRRAAAAPVDVVQQNFPDPGLYQDGDGTWYAYATRTIGSGINIPVAKSSDWTSWSVLTDSSSGKNYDALPTLPAWAAATPNTWAPGVDKLNDGTYIMYFAASSAQDNTKHCVGAATSKSVTGPFSPVGNTLFCDLSVGGAIDPAPFVDSDGQRYITYKVDGNSLGNGGACGNSVAPIKSTPLKLQPVAADGLTFTGNAVTLLDNAGASDDGIVENPSLFKSGSTYYLFFSSGCFADSSYTVSYATASNLRGPYTRASAPLLATGDNSLTSPGGASVWKDGTHLVFHAGAWGNRQLYTASISTSGTTIDFIAQGSAENALQPLAASSAAVAPSSTSYAVASPPAAVIATAIVSSASQIVETSPILSRHAQTVTAASELPVVTPAAALTTSSPIATSWSSTASSKPSSSVTSTPSLYTERAQSSATTSRSQSYSSVPSSTTSPSSSVAVATTVVQPVAQLPAVTAAPSTSPTKDHSAAAHSITKSFSAVLTTVGVLAIALLV